MKFLILYLRAVKVLSGVADLASKYGCSNLCSSPKITFFFVILFQKIFRKLEFSFFSNFEIPISVVGGCQSTLRGCKSFLKIWLLKS